MPRRSQKKASGRQAGRQTNRLMASVRKATYNEELKKTEAKNKTKKKSLRKQKENKFRLLLSY